jgi:hypothetical protein
MCIEESPPFSYTIGLHSFGLPELLVTGVWPERGRALLNYFAEETMLSGPPAPGDRIELGPRERIEVVEVDHPDAHMGIGLALMGPEVRALQLVWTDAFGRWPWHRDFNRAWGRQPVLGMRVPQNE